MGHGIRPKALLALAALTLASAGLASITESDPAAAGGPPPAGTQYTFQYTGAPQVFTVPDGVTFLTMDVIGGRGGFPTHGGTPGAGGEAVAGFDVTPGTQKLTIWVGQNAGGDGGWGYSCGGDGGIATEDVTNSAKDGGGGGGSSAVTNGEWTSGAASCDSSTRPPDQPLVVGGGGGGGGGKEEAVPTYQGGNGGAGTPQAGMPAQGDDIPQGGCVECSPNQNGAKGDNGGGGGADFSGGGGGGGGGYVLPAFGGNGGGGGGQSVSVDMSGGAGGAGGASNANPNASNPFIIPGPLNGSGVVTLSTLHQESLTACGPSPQHLSSIPAEVQHAHVTAEAGAGGTRSGGNNAPPGTGGHAGIVSADITSAFVGTAWSDLDVWVGCHGTDASDGGGGDGYGAGGFKGEATVSLADDGAGGGGGSAVFLADNPLLVAGGGGGGGGGALTAVFTQNDGGDGGDGGNGTQPNNGAGHDGGGGSGISGDGGCAGANRGNADFNGDGGGTSSFGSGGGGGGGGGGGMFGACGGEGGNPGEGGGGGGGGGGSHVSDGFVGVNSPQYSTSSGSGTDGSVVFTYGISTPTHVVAFANANQTAVINNQFAEPLVAMVYDQDGFPMVGVQITFSMPAPAPDVPSGTFADGTTSATVATNDVGKATSPAIKANAVDGTWQVQAAITGDVPPADFALTNLRAQTATAISPTPGSGNPSIGGEPVSFFASVIPEALEDLLPSGTVQFLIGDSPMGPPVPVNNEIAFSQTIFPEPGTYIISAFFEPDTGFLPSSATYTQVVIPPTSATAVVSSVNPSESGEAVTFTASVSGNGGPTPTGTVTFDVDNTQLGDVTLVNGSATSPPIHTLGIGTHPVMAFYSGDALVTPSVGTLTQTVHSDNGTATEVSTSPNPSVYGETVTYSATVKADDSASGTPSGTATFLIDGTQVCAETLANGTASCQPSGLLDPGSHAVVVEYSGDTEFAASSGSATQQVTQATSDTAITSNLEPSQFGEPVTFTADVSVESPGGGAPTGTVQFLVGGLPLGDPVPVSGGIAAAAPTSTLAVGVSAVTALYSGDAGHTGSSETLFQHISRGATTTSVSSSADPSTYGEAVTFTSHVTPAFAGGADPTGTVRVLVDDILACDTPISGDGTATCPAPPLTPGDHAVTAEYSGDFDFVASDGSLTQHVSKVTSTTTLESSLNPSQAGQSVTLTANVLASLGGAAPVGTVTFTEGSTVLGTAPVLPSLPDAGRATFETSDFTVGTHEIVATYSGHAATDGSASAPLTQTVDSPPLHFQPDAMRETVRLGRDIYDDGSFAYQTSFENVQPRFGATLDIYIQNNGNETDDFLLTGVGSSPGFLVRYQQLVAPDGSKPKNYITEQVVGDGFLMNDIPPGGEVKVRILVKVSVNAAIGSEANLLLRATSVTDPVKFDANRLFVTVVR